MRTARLVLRRWHDSDSAPFAAMNADPDVMRFFPSVLSRAESDALIKRIEVGFERDSFGLWAVERFEEREFIGFAGLSRVPFDAHFTPAVEIGWRLASDHWGHGYATEAARAAMEYGFDTVGLREIVSFTASANLASRRVMERLAMSRDPHDDFENPRVPHGSPLRTHVLYRRSASAWRAGRTQTPPAV